MRCYFCDKILIDGESENFICVCNKCLELAEASEARMVKTIYALTKERAGFIQDPD